MRALAVDHRSAARRASFQSTHRIRLSVRHELRAYEAPRHYRHVHVTHDREGDDGDGDRIVILNANRIAQRYARGRLQPAGLGLRYAAFMGAENVISLNGAPQGGDFLASRLGPRMRPNRVALMGRGLAQGIVEGALRRKRLESTPPRPPSSAGVTRGEIAAVSYPGGHWRHAVHVGDREIMADMTAPSSRAKARPGTCPRRRPVSFNSPGSQPANAISRVSPGKVHA